MSKVLTYKYSTEAIANFSNSELARQEKNDCVVRAVAAASGSAYEPAHQFVKEVFGRNNQEGTFGVGVTIEKIAGVTQTIGKSQTTFEVLLRIRKSTTTSYTVRLLSVRRQLSLSSRTIRKEPSWS